MLLPVSWSLPSNGCIFRSIWREFLEGIKTILSTEVNKHDKRWEITGKDRKSRSGLEAFERNFPWHILDREQAIIDDER